MKTILKRDDMYTLCGGLSKMGWYGAGLTLHDADRPYLSQIEALFFGETPFTIGGEDFDTFFNRKANACKSDTILPDAWVRAVTGARRTLVYFSASGAERTLAVADRIYGPVAPSDMTEKPCIAWIEKPTFDVPRWVLRCFDGERVRDVVFSCTPMSSPAVAVVSDAPVFAYAADATVHVVRADGTEIAHVHGKYPALASDDEGLLLVVERTERERGMITLALSEPLRPECGETLLYRGELNLHAYAKAHAGGFYVAFESRPSWGADHLLAMTSTLHVVRYLDGRIDDCPQVPEARVGFRESQQVTIQSVHVGMPRLFEDGGRLGLAVRRFRVEGFRMNLWDIEICMLDEAEFMPFRRVTAHGGAPDTGYALLGTTDGLMLMSAAYSEAAMCREFSTRAEVVLVDDERLAHVNPPKSLRDCYQWEPSAAGIGKRVEKPLCVSGFTALRGDVHNHTLYSKCMSSPDGSPDDAVRYYLDLLGMNLLCFTDHTDRIGFPQYTWTVDRLEELAGNQAIVLYGMEPSAAPDHDTNYYAATRSESEILRLTSLFSLRRDKVYCSIRHHLAEGRAVAVRHCHGRVGGECGIYTDKTLSTHTPDLEWAMEALQLRGNIILGESFENPQRHFPCNFLNSGAKLGLLGGTDHDLQMVLNHLGYTGFWAKNASADAALEAVRLRRTYAVANGLAELWTDWDGEPMGAEMGRRQSVSIRFQAAAARPLRAAALLRDGTLLPWKSLAPDTNVSGVLTDDAPDSGAHWYAVVLKGDSFFTEEETDRAAAPMRLALAGAGQTRNDCCMVFASPYFVTIP